MQMCFYQKFVHSGLENTWSFRMQTEQDRPMQFDPKLYYKL